MKAAVVDAFGQALSIKDLPVPRPGHGQVLVPARLVFQF
jgi:NADPH:quinone reductase-like Zn-dependent oxidoreductase